jgi:c-di-GMP-binding flagellar brake protein YcgR
MSVSLSDEEIEDRYFLRGRMEILNVLNDVIYRRESVMVNFNGGKDFFLTRLLEARHDALIFDLSGDVKANQRLPESPGCIFVVHLNGIHIQFSGSQARRFSWGGSDAFWVPLPERIIRRQRRESYRILLPVTKPLMVKLFSDDGILLDECPLHDLSVGGIGVTINEGLSLEPGQTIARVNLTLSKQRAINCAAEVRHVSHCASRTWRRRWASRSSVTSRESNMNGAG